MGLTRAFLPSFRARKSGTIIMISSVDAWVGRAGFSAYTASKYALEGKLSLTIVCYFPLESCISYISLNPARDMQARYNIVELI